MSWGEYLYSFLYGIESYFCMVGIMILFFEFIFIFVDCENFKVEVFVN